MKKQRLNFNTKLSLACAKNDDLRPSFNCIHFKDGYALATDAYIMIKQSLEYHDISGKEHLEGKYLHRYVFDAIYKYPVATATEEGIICTDHFDNKILFYYADGSEFNYPDFDKIINDFTPIETNNILLNIDLAIKANKLLFKGGDNGVNIEYGKYYLNKIRAVDSVYSDQVIIFKGQML